MANTSTGGDDDQNKGKQAENDIPTENAMDIDHKNEFASVEGMKEYDQEELNQELGEDENLKYTQADDPSFDADFNADEGVDENDNFDSSFLMGMPMTRQMRKILKCKTC